MAPWTVKGNRFTMTFRKIGAEFGGRTSNQNWSFHVLLDTKSSQRVPTQPSGWAIVARSTLLSRSSFLDVDLVQVLEIPLYGGFLKWCYPTTIGFPTKNDHFGVFRGYHYFRKHPYRHWYQALDVGKDSHVDSAISRRNSMSLSYWVLVLFDVRLQGVHLVRPCIFDASIYDALKILYLPRRCDWKDGFFK